MIQKASKYQAVPKDRKPLPKLSRFQVLVREARKQQTLREWFETELKEGKFLHNYVSNEKHDSEMRWRRVAKQVHGRKQNNKSEMRAIAHIPARDYIRWCKTDPHFFEDNANLRSLKRDVPDAAILI